MLYDRTLRWSSVAVAQVCGAVRVLAEIKPGGEGEQRWDEVKWDGKPGERSVWMVIPSGKGRPQQLYHVALKGTGPIRRPAVGRETMPRSGRREDARGARGKLVTAWVTGSHTP